MNDLRLTSQMLMVIRSLESLIHHLPEQAKLVGLLYRWIEPMVTRAKAFSLELRNHLRTCKQILRDPRTPRQSRVLLGVGLAYLPFPLSLVVSPCLILMAFRIIPKEIVADCKIPTNH